MFLLLRLTLALLLLSGCVADDHPDPSPGLVTGGMADGNLAFVGDTDKPLNDDTQPESDGEGVASGGASGDDTTGGETDSTTGGGTTGGGGDTASGTTTTGDDCVSTCSGKQCGDDGCGGSCGTCPGGAACVANSCGCIANCSGKACGDDGCGGSCGSCPAGQPCEEGQCVCQSSCAGKQCGDNGCGGSCGSCPSTALCVQTLCVCQTDCANKQCGSDGCGGQCGFCPGGTLCEGHKCVCPPKCNGKQCGPDGCGGQCGSCSGFQSCKVDKCVGWGWEAESDGALGHEQGAKEGDGWACNTGAHSENFMVYGPYLKEASAGSYLANFRMQVDNNTADNNAVVVLEAYDSYSKNVLAKKTVTRKEFGAPNAYQDITLVFETDGQDSLEFRIKWLDTAYIKVDRITVTQ